MGILPQCIEKRRGMKKCEKWKEERNGKEERDPTGQDREE
jgi:hypothetical protein